MSKTNKQLNHITKASIEIGDKMKKEFDSSNDIEKATAAIKAYNTAIKSISVRKYKS